MESASSFVSSFGYNFSFQLLARVFSFAVNLYLLRVVDKELLGVANVRLTLLYTTILFLAREPFRKAFVHKEKVQHPNNRVNIDQSLISLLWLCPLLSLICSFCLCIIWLNCLTVPDASLVPNYHSCVFLFALAAFIETLVEPLWIIAQHYAMVRSIAAIQGVHIFCQRLFVAILVFFAPQTKLYSFAYAMVLSSLLYSILFILSLNQSLPFSQLLPRASPAWHRLSLASSFLFHSLVKQILTDGALYLITFTHTLDFGEQAIYDAIDKIGSLVARILLAPLEESAYVYFSHNVQRDCEAREQHKSSFTIATNVLYGLLRCTSIIGLMVCAFGQSYAYIALKLYAGDLLCNPTGVAMLRLYCVYVWLLALNGITECFAFAAMNQKQVNRHQKLLILFTGIYIFAQILFSSWFRGLGFVLANCVNMISRIFYSLWFIGSFYRTLPNEKPLSHLLPNMYVISALVISLMFTFLSHLLFCCDDFINSVAHILLGAVAFVATCITVYTTDFELMRFVEKFLLRRKDE